MLMFEEKQLLVMRQGPDFSASKLNWPLSRRGSSRQSSENVRLPKVKEESQREAWVQAGQKGADATKKDEQRTTITRPCLADRVAGEFRMIGPMCGARRYMVLRPHIERDAPGAAVC